MKTPSTATLTILAEHKKKVVELLASSKISVTIEAVSKNDDGTNTISCTGSLCKSDDRLTKILDGLQQNNISYGYVWKENGIGGEIHFRHNGDFGELWSWLDCEKNTVNIEDVRAAMTEGDTAVFELLDSTETRYSPWTWQEVSA